MARLFVFDLDGTLVDSRRDLADAANALIVEHGGSPLAVDSIAGMVGEGAALLVRRALASAGVKLDVERDLRRFLELYDERLLANTAPYPGTREALDDLTELGSLAVLTNKPQRHTSRLLAGLDLASYFQWVVGGDTMHGRKPDPAGMNYLIAAAGSTPDETMMIGDSVIDVRTARAAGARMCLVRYGFGFGTIVDPLSAAELFADRPSDLPNLLASAL